MVAYLGTAGNCAFLRGALRAAYGKDKSEWSLANSMAATLGPSEEECKSHISDGSVANDNPDGTASVVTYSKAVRNRAQSPAASFVDKTRYYTDGAGTQKWQKSLETLAALYNIENEDSCSTDLRRRRSSSSGIFEPPHAGSLKAPVTVIWGQKTRRVLREFASMVSGIIWRKEVKLCYCRGLGIGRLWKRSRGSPWVGLLSGMSKAVTSMAKGMLQQW